MQGIKSRFAGLGSAAKKIAFVGVLLALCFWSFIFFYEPFWSFIEDFGSEATESSLVSCEGEKHENWNNCQGSITTENGDKYVGEWKSGKANGRGVLTRADGFQYMGEFKDNKFHGQGAMTTPDGDRYVGEFKDNNFHGQGTFTGAEGDNYVGEWKDGNPSGQGTLTTSEQSGNFWDELPANDRYEWIKQRSVDENLRVFDLYEKQKTIKVINVCADAHGFTVQASWDLEIEDEKGAFEVASDSCGGVGVVLLGYTIKSEVKF